MSTVVNKENIAAVYKQVSINSRTIGSAFSVFNEMERAIETTHDYYDEIGHKDLLIM